MLLVSWTTVRSVKAIVGLVPVAVGGLLVFAGLGDPTAPENLLLLGIGGVLVATGGYNTIVAIAGRDAPAEGTGLD